MDTPTAIQALAALAHPVRMDAFRALVVAGPDGLAQKTLAEEVGVGPTNLVFHLKELAAAGLVTHEQIGRNVIYRAAYKQMDSVIGFLTKNCCAGLRRPAKATAACS